MKKKNILYYIFLLGLLMFSSCSDFLDTMPDNRTEIDSKAKITSLLVSAYPTSLPVMAYELSSDNTVDNGSQYDPFWKEIKSMYLWQDVKEVDNDNPSGIWDACYIAAAAANQALKAIEEQGSPASLNPQKGEALLCRAYAHFVLANTFCMPYNPTTASKDMGIPFSSAPETKPVVDYERGTMEALYKKIATDIEEGLPLIDDDIYSVPRYHFNKKAAYAFATRFYLFYTQADKSNYKRAIECANAVLGTGSPTRVLRDWAGINALSTDLELRGNAYISASEQSNLLLNPIYSVWGYAHGPYESRNKRYGNSSGLFSKEGPQANGPWGAYSNLRVTSNNVFGLIQKRYIPKMLAYFEYTDKAAGIGFLHLVVPAFTTDETLLCRAEAYILSEQYGKAVTDINDWLKTHVVNYTAKTQDDLVEFYNKISYMPTSVISDSQRTIKKKLNSQGFTVSEGVQENLIQCILHLRRIETVHEGLRWLDVKRYGIEIAHNRSGESDDVLLKDDPRRAIQLPQDVIAAGLEANPR